MPESIKVAIEIGIIFTFFYYLLMSLKGTRGAGIFKGVIFISLVTILLVGFTSSLLKLTNIAFAMQTLVLPILITLLIIVFQPELRRVLLNLGQAKIFSFLSSSSSHITIDEIVAALMSLSSQKQGALIALEKEIGLRPYIEGGVQLNSDVSKELIETIFYPGSALHDGGVVIKDDRITAAGCLFPLTENPNIPKDLGTRHRAGVGLTEESDALVIVASEETGKISVCLHGQLHMDLSRDALTKFINENYIKK